MWVDMTGGEENQNKERPTRQYAKPTTKTEQKTISLSAKTPHELRNQIYFDKVANSAK